MFYVLALVVGFLCADLYHYLNHRFQHKFIHTSSHRGHHTVYNPKILVTDTYASYDGKGDVEPLNSYWVPGFISALLFGIFFYFADVYAAVLVGVTNFCMRFFYHWFSFLSHTTHQKGIWKHPQQNHFIHHFEPYKNLGDPFFIWDRLLGTFKRYDKEVNIKIEHWSDELRPAKLSNN